MAEPFVIFPGTAGNYISTDDVNLADADTAHLEQSIGEWVPNGGSGAISLSNAIAPLFGNSHGFIGAGTGYPFARTGEFAAGNGFAVTPGLSYSASLGLSASVAGQARIQVFYKDAAWVDTAASIEDKKAYTVDELTEYTVDMGIAPPLTTHIWLQTTWYAPDGTTLPSRIDTEFYFDALCVREGSDPTFVPSLRIVGDLDYSFKVSDKSGTGSRIPLARNGGNVGDVLSYQTQFSDDSYQPFWKDDSGTTINETLNGVIAGDGDPHSYRTTLEVATGRVAGYRDGVERASTVHGATSVAPNPSALEIGGAVNGSAAMWTGDIYTATVNDGIDVPVVAIFDAADIVLP